jgi:predicted secreted hydrolase
MMLTTMSPRAMAQGFAGLGEESKGFAQVVPGVPLDFPRDHGAHPDFRIEWWYLTANLQDASGARYGAQWTLFRQATIPGNRDEGWDSRQLWMCNAAITSANSHYFTERLARGGVGEAGVDVTPFRAWIDSWEMRGGNAFSSNAISPLEVSAIGPDFGFSLQLASSKPLVLQGEGGYSKKSERGQASYYYSQPFFSAAGALTLKDKQVAVTGHAWMDREWSSQPLAPDQTGWDWFSLHLESGEKIMLFRLRQNDGQNYFAANWITESGRSTLIARETIAIMPLTFTDIAGRRLPTSWSIVIGARGVKIESVPLNPKSWMGTRFAYWEGPISFSGSHNGTGYLEMTGY